MYNKLFSKIVDSSVWMEPDHIRIVWMMFIAIMDEDGFVNLASIKNVAHRAVMELDKAQSAIDVLEGPDPESSNPANGGRRLTRVPGGWLVNNANEYRNIVKREHQKELNRERVKKHRQRKAEECNAPVMPANENVTPSEAEAYTEAKDQELMSPKATKPKTNGSRLPDDWFPSFELAAWAKSERPNLNLKTEIEKFRDFWHAKAGANARKVDWDKTFKNWIRNTREQHNGNHPTPNRKLSVFEQVQQTIERQQANRIGEDDETIVSTQ